MTVAGPMALMLVTTIVLSLRRLQSGKETPTPLTALQLESPFTLSAVLKFGFVFLLLGVAGGLAQRFLGSFGFYTVSLVGGLVSSASSVASAANLSSQKEVSALVAGNGAVLASLASVASGLPLVIRIAKQPRLSIALGSSVGIILLMGLTGVAICMLFFNG